MNFQEELHMLCPREKSLKIGEGNYNLKCDYTGISLYDFFILIKDGNEDVKISKSVAYKKEQYRLLIAPSGIEITVSCDEGLFRASTSLWQLVARGEKAVPCADIEDEPLLARRGYMLDISRCRMANVKTIKELIDVLCMFKYNEFQIYMESLCFKYSAYPKYTEDFDCLGPDDIKEIEEYCAARYIDLVPNQNSLGHMREWLKLDEFRPLGLGDGTNVPNTVNPLLDESFEFVTKLFDSVLPHFKSEYVNIGLDEAYGLGLFQTEEYCKKHGKETLWIEWLAKVNNYIKEKYNKKVMYWADMIAKNRDIYKNLPKDAIALEWGYENQDMAAMGEHCALFHDLGVKFFVCPSCNTHASFTGRSDVVLSHIRTAAQIAVRNGAEGLLMTEWGTAHGETGHPHFGVWELIPLAIAGQYAWNANDLDCDGSAFGIVYLRMAQDMLDKFVFGGAKVAELLFRMGNYYLLEPVRVPVATMCGANFWKPISETKLYSLFDLKDFDVEYYFKNVIRYMTELISEVEKQSFDEQLKREILINAKMVVLAAELCIIRVKKDITCDKINELVGVIDRMIPEFRELWCKRNYEKGVELFISHLEMHRADLMEMKK